MCYCCGSVLWSRVDNSHTRLVNLDVKLVVGDVLTIATKVANYMFVQYESPTEYSLKFHVGKTPSLTVTEWDMVYPPEVTSCQVALCGIFSTTIKKAPVAAHSRRSECLT